MTALKTFEKSTLGKVRIVIRNDEPWFVAKDIAACIGYDLTSVNKMCNLCREKDKVVASASDFDSENLSESGNARITLVSESGLYRILAKSNLPKCEQFEIWVFEEVLPSIRKRGVYSTEEFANRCIEDPDWAISVFQDLKFERQRRALAEAQRNEAIRTKAWIGERREATAMNTASQFSKKCTKLQGENEGLRERLGDAERWKAVTAIKWLSNYFEPTQGLYGAIAAKLKNICKEFGFERRDIPDPKWGVVKIYPIEAIDILRRRIELDANMLANYRKLEA